MAGSEIAINDSGYKGYLSVPDSGKGPGILVIQEIFGVNSHIRDVADLYAKAGFTALAPDVFWRVKQGVQLGYTPEDIQQGIEIAGKLNQDQTLDDLKQAITKLKSLPQTTGKVASTGYCMGGTYSYLLATADAVDAAISYYGGTIVKNLDRASNLHCPIILHFGEHDAHIPMTDVEKIRAALKGKGHVELYTYDADHGFNCDQRSSYDRKSAMLAFARSMIVLHGITT
jgi:carboxymethylenebutenolidase